jgi:rRNA maturation protein Rpf1
MQMVPNMFFYRRKTFTVKAMCKEAGEKGFTHIVILSEKNKVRPRTLTRDHSEARPLGDERRSALGTTQASTPPGCDASLHPSTRSDARTAFDAR